MGVTSPEETRDVEGWAKQFPEVADEIASIQEGMEAYAQLHAITPDESVKQKIFAKLSAASATAPVISIKEKRIDAGNAYATSAAWKYAAAASILLLIGTLYFTYTYYKKYDAAQQELASAQTELKQQKDMAQGMHEDMDKMSDMHAMPVSLKGMDDVPNAAARIYWMQNTHEVYIDPSNLPPAPAGMQYQFWGIVDGKPVSGGMISTTKDGNKIRLLKMRSFGKAEAFAVSLEKAGPEMPAPSKVYVMGKI